MILLNHVSAHYGAIRVVNDVSFHILKGETVALVGPNGAGKSSLLRIMTGLLSPDQGSVQIGGMDLSRLSPRERAKRLAVVPQEILRDAPYLAYDFVLLGRTAFLPRFGGPSADDHRAIEEAMRLTETWELRQRLLPEMSGGERQRLALAMALAARPEIILLDEPTSHLDIRHRAEMMRLLTRLNRERQTTILMVVHDLTLASQFFPRLILLCEGRCIADGTPAEVLRQDVLETAYACPVSVIPLPDGSATCILPRV